MTQRITRISAKFETSLSLKVNIGDTEATLVSALDADGTVLPSGRYGFTVDESTSDFEYFEADLVSTALTNVKSFSVTTRAETTGFTKEHGAGHQIKITDYTVLGTIVDLLRGTVDFDSGTPLKYDGTPSLSDPNAFATVQYVLDNVVGGTVTFNANVIAGIAGETISGAGVWMYLKESDGRWYKTDANTESTVKNVRLGMSKGAGSVGGSIAGGVFIGGVETTGTYVAGTTYYLSNTAGALSTSAGEYEAFVGIGDGNSDLIFLNVYDPEGVTPDEKDGLVGTQGTVTSNNKYVTADNLSASSTDQSQTTDDSSMEFGEADATTKKNKIAQSFTARKTKIRGVIIRREADTGTNAGDITVAIQADSSGNPSGSNLVSKTLTAAIFNAHSVNQEVEFLFASEYTTLTLGSTYWIVVSSSTASTTNHSNISANSAGGYSGGSLKYNNTTDGWVSAGSSDIYFKVLEGNSSQVPKTDSTGNLSSLLLNYMRQTVITATGTFTVPSDVDTIKVMAWGGTGGGSGGSGSVEQRKQGGSGGEFCMGIFTVTPNEVINITIGAAGTAGSTGGDGGNGGNTLVKDSLSTGTRLTVTANGGQGGDFNTLNGLGGTGGAVSGTALVANSNLQINGQSGCTSSAENSTNNLGYGGMSGFGGRCGGVSGTNGGAGAGLEGLVIIQY